MKHKNIFLWLLAFMPLCVTLVAMQTMPSSIPAHFGFDGAVDRWGSKYELLLMPIITLIFIVTMLAVGSYAQKQKGNSMHNQKVLTITNYIIAIIFNIMTFYILYVSYNGVENIYKADIDGMRILGIVLSGSYIFLGNVLPKCKQNSMVGIRTKWTMASESVWYKTHRMGGMLMTGFGLVATLLCLTIFGGMAAIIFACIGMLSVSVAVIVYSYIIYKKEVNNEKNI